MPSPYAFPQELFGTETGLTIRDYFAIRILPIILRETLILERTNGEKFFEASKLAYSIADIMMEARKP
jgi:hypothetical protein